MELRSLCVCVSVCETVCMCVCCVCTCARVCARACQFVFAGGGKWLPSLVFAEPPLFCTCVLRAQDVRAHQDALSTFMLRVQQLAAMWARLASTGTTPPEQFASFQDVLGRAHAALLVRGLARGGVGWDGWVFCLVVAHKWLQVDRCHRCFARCSLGGMC
jgi:hypothetical protein